MMATNCCYSITLLDASKRGFIFCVDTTGLCTDSFKQADTCITYRLHTNTDKILLLNEDGEFQAQMLQMWEQQQPECKFNIQFYDHVKNNHDNKKQHPVIMYVKKDNKTMVAYCKDEKEVHPEKMDIPERIDESCNPALFYLTNLTGSSKWMFESSLYPKRYLGFEPDEDDVNLDRLVLREGGYDQVDESNEFIPKQLTPKTPSSFF